MKLILFALTLSLTSIATASNAHFNALVGQYVALDGSKKALVATVAVRDGKVLAKFEGGCTAEIIVSNSVIKGGCTVGVGYGATYFDAQIKNNGKGFEMVVQSFQNGDSQVFGGVKSIVAYKKN